MTVIIQGRGQDYDGHAYRMSVVPNVGDTITFPSGHEVIVTKRNFYAADDLVDLTVRPKR